MKENLLIERVKVMEEELIPLVASIEKLEFPLSQRHTKKELTSTINRIGGLPICTDEQILSFFKHINQLPNQTENELNALIVHLKSQPKQEEAELRNLIRTLKELPAHSQAELEVLVEHLGCFPEHTEEELVALVEHIKYLPKRVVAESKKLTNRIAKLPNLSGEESRALLIEIWHRKEFPKDIYEGLIALIERISLISHLKLVFSLRDFDKDPQRELIFLTNLIKKNIPSSALIVLFGSYAKGTEVRYDENYIDGVLTTYQSDFDIMVVTRNIVTDPKIRGFEQLLRSSVTDAYNNKFANRLHAPPQYIVESIQRLSGFLVRKQCFFTDIMTEGIILYDSGEYTLPKPQVLSFRAIMENAQVLFNQCIYYADTFLKTAYYNFNDGDYGMGAFQSHQACEKYYNAMGMVFDNFNPKLHDLVELINKTKKYSRDLSRIFPRSTDFERRSFRLLYEAYIHARYDIRYEVKKEELSYMLERVEALKEVAYRLCREKLSEYEHKMLEQEKDD